MTGILKSFKAKAKQRLFAESRFERPRLELNESKREITAFGEFGWNIGDEDIQRQLNKLGPGGVTVLLNSMGGDSDQGVAIYNLFKRHGEIDVVVVGNAGSAASLAALGGRTLTMNLGTEFWIHRAWILTIGNAEDLRATAKELDKLDESVTDIYVANSNLTADEVRKAQKGTDGDGTFYTAKEAYEAGFATAYESADSSESAESTGAQSAKRGASEALRRRMEFDRLTMAG